MTYFGFSSASNREMDPHFDVPHFEDDSGNSINEEYASMMRNKRITLKNHGNEPNYKYLLEKEARYGCRGKWFKHRTDFGERDRTSLIRWMVAVHRDLSVELFNCGNEITTNSLFLAIMYFDRALEMDFLMPIVYMQCMASAAVVLGIKVDSHLSTTSSLYKFNKMNQYFNNHLITGAEGKICQDHNWEVTLITPNDALCYYIDRLKLFDHEIVIMMSQYLVEVGYHFPDVGLYELPSGMAAGALYCSLIGFGLLNGWHQDYQLLTGYRRVKMERLARSYAEMHLIAARTFQCNATFIKYAIPEMKYVAIIDIGKRWRNCEPLPPFDHCDLSDED